MQHCVIDHGNTRTKLSIFEGDVIVHRAVLYDMTLQDLKTFLEPFDTISKVALSATGHFEEDFKLFLRKHYQFIELTHETQIPIQNHYETPKTLGKDRLAAVIAAHGLYPQQNVLVIDAGTCITYDFVTAAGDYYGGSIAPGLSMRFRAMHEFTAKLPLITKADTTDFIGVNTETAMRTGAQYGFIYEIEGFYNAYIQRFGVCKTLLTGGDAVFIAQHLVHLQFEIQNDLVPIGLNAVLKHHFHTINNY
jgi:type III pantothenate kinase